MGQAQPVYDNKSQLDRVAALVMPSERIVAVYDLREGGTGFIGLTNRRIIFLDQNFLDRKDAAIVSIPLSRISYVAITTEHKMLGRDSSSLTVAVTGRTFEFEFNGTDKAQRMHHALTYYICL